MLHVDGYVILRDSARFSDDVVARLVKHGSTKRQTIFNYNDPRTGNGAVRPTSIDTTARTGNDDGLRTQAHMNVQKVPWLCAVRSVVQNAISPVISNRHELAHWAVLASWPGCQRQHRHCDHDPATFAGLADPDVPMAIVVALQPGTSMLVWPGCIRGRFPDEGTDGTRLVLDRNDVLIFRGDLVHAGDAYTTFNARIHVFADAIHVNRRRNETYLV